MTLLIVDDDIPTVEVIRDAIDWKALGIGRVLTGYNIHQAMELMGEGSVDIILCDIEMPKGSGLDLLKWAREREMNGEFIFLTNHESFSFATTAMEHQALSYILKPFDPQRITREVARAAEKIKQERRLEEYSEYGSYWVENKPVVEQRFWRDMLFSAIIPQRENMEGELRKRNIALSPDSPLYLALLCVPWREETARSWGRSNRGIFEYSLAKLCAELLLDELTTEHVVLYNQEEKIYIACVLPERSLSQDLPGKCRRLLELCRKTLDGEGTCYLEGPVELAGLAEARERMERRDRDNILFRGQVLEGEASCGEDSGSSIDLGDLEQLLVAGDKLKILTALRSRMEALSATRRLNAAAMRAVQQNLVQAVYVYLYNKGIQPDALFQDEISFYLMNRAVNSLYDMVKWQSVFITKAIDYDRELQKKQPVIQQAKQFVHAHYREEISRNEVAQHVYLTPEYFAKLFKKETGLSIKEYINRHRLEQARALLETTDLQVGDIAGRVGFDNFSYFSTLFKKWQGCSPNEYKSRVHGSQK